MRSRRSGLLTALLIIAACSIPQPGRAATPAGMLPPSGPFPDAVCNGDSAGDIYIGPDRRLWECICEKIYSADDFVCDWFDQGPVSRSRAARLVRRAKLVYHVPSLPRLVVIRL